MGQTSRAWARRRMLSASRPSSATTATAASRIRSRDRPGARAPSPRLRFSLAPPMEVVVVYGVHRAFAREAMALGGARAFGNGEVTARTAKLRVPRGLARRLAWFALAGQGAFVAAWGIARALQPGYSHLAQPLRAPSSLNGWARC